MGCLLAILLVALFRVSPPHQIPWTQALVLLGAAALCELTPVLFKDVGGWDITISLTAPIYLMTMVLYGSVPVILVSSGSLVAASGVGWLAAALCARIRASRAEPLGGGEAVLYKILARIGHDWSLRISSKPSLLLIAFANNLMANVLVIAAGALVYVLAGGRFLGFFPHSELSQIEWGHFAVAAVPAVSAYFIVTWALGDINLAVTQFWSGRRFTAREFLFAIFSTFRATVHITIRGDAFITALAVVLMGTYLVMGPVAIVVLLVPFWMIRDVVQQTVRQIEFYRDTVTTLGTYMQRYHPHTRGHLKRVANLSERLAKELRMPAGSVMLMPEAGMLHDIGKICVGVETLDKVGNLTDEEWASIKEHPVKGAEIISHLPYLEKIVDWIKYHHKWADGSGYPEDGAADGRVPPEAAILAVVDAFDAMTDDREMCAEWVCDSCGYRPEDGSRPEACPKCGMMKRRIYREPLNLNQAIDQLRRGSGTQFSPVVVKAFLRMVDRDGIHTSA